MRKVIEKDTAATLMSLLLCLFRCFNDFEQVN